MKTRNISPKMMSFINVTISLLINIVLLLLLVKNNYFSYATNDDFDMTLSVTGAYGTYSPYTLFSGYWIGLALKYLYQFFPICNWITIINISAIFIFFVYFFNLLLRKGKLLGASLGIALILIAYPYLYNLNYTKTAAIITLLGLTIMSELLEQIYSSCFVISKRVLCLQIFIAYLLIFIGAQIRIEPMLFMLVYIIPFIFYFYKKTKHLFKNNIHIKTSDMHPLLVYITLGGVRY